MPQTRRSGQRWIMDQMFRIAGHDLMFPGALAFRLERGYRYAETKRTLDRIQTFRQNAREWARKVNSGKFCRARSKPGRAQLSMIPYMLRARVAT